MQIANEFTITDVLKRRYEKDYNFGYINQQGYARSLESLKIIQRHPLGTMMIRDVEAKHLELFFMDMKRYSNSIIRKTYAQIRAAFRIAAETGITDRNIIEEMQLRCPKSVKADKVVRAFTEQEQKLFEKALEEHKVPDGRNSYKNQIYISLYSGMRMGEVNALKEEDIDFENRIVHVRRTISRDIDGNSFVKDGTKTETSRRDIPMSARLEKALRKAVGEKKEKSERPAVL